MHARVTRVVFGASDPKVGATEALATLQEDGAGFNHRFDVTGGILAEEAASLLTRFFRERRESQAGGGTNG